MKIGTTFDADALAAFSTAVLCVYGVPKVDAKLAAGILALADQRGIDSHGIARLHTYAGLLKEGAINPRPDISVIRETAATATMDGDNGMGLVVGPRANALAGRKASEVGTGWVAVRNSNHFGIAGFYVLESLRNDQIGMAMSNSTAIVAPLWGRSRRLGTNPFAIAFPGQSEPPVVIDMATSTVALGKIEVAARNGSEIPQTWAIDINGDMTVSPEDVFAGGSILTLGFDRTKGGHKGYCLSAMVDIFSGVLSGAAWGPNTPPFESGRAKPERQVGPGIGHFFGATAIDGFADVREFKQEVDEWIRTFRRTVPSDTLSPVLIPGDPELVCIRSRVQGGIPLHEKVVRNLLLLADQTGVSFPEPYT